MMALLHHPVKNKNGEVIASAVTNLDIHDIARIAKTYGVSCFYVVTPLDDQKALVEKIIRHWTDGFGGQYNPKRREALDLVRVMDSVDAVLAEIRAETGKTVRLVATCATEKQPALRVAEFRRLLEEGEDVYLMAFGTAWGLTDAFLADADFVLEPIRGRNGYNHLPVRAAAAVFLDRLLGGCN
jgi:hypothetical protein